MGIFHSLKIFAKVLITFLHQLYGFIMCGISFYCSTIELDKSALDLSLKSMAHRGPDSSGQLHMQIGQYFLGLGHNRLSILDLSPLGAQPMESNSGQIIAYNGEIYNHLTLKENLKAGGYHFNSNTDTEVILALYEENGIAALNMLQGMFAFVLLDKKLQRLMVVRDSLGIKPIYLYRKHNQIYGASEIKGLKVFPNVSIEIDRNDVFEFFNNGFLYEPSTGYRDIKKLLPGYCLEIDLITGAQQEINYSRLKSFYSSKPLRELAKITIQEQLTADAPLGVFFSGGVDSSIIAANIENQHLFFAQYDTKSQADLDYVYSHKVANYLKKEITLSSMKLSDKSPDDLMKTVDFVALNTEELISDYTFWSSFQLSNLARENGYKVMLSGMGGDEIFAGYPRYLILAKQKWLKAALPLIKLAYKTGIYPRRVSKKIERLISYCSEKYWPIAYSRLLGYFTRKELTIFFQDIELLEQNYKNKLETIEKSYLGNISDKVKLAQHFDLYGFLAHNLTVSDKSSMLASIEIRVPLLGEYIVAHGLSLSTNSLLKRWQLKYPLISLLRDSIPLQLVKRPKVGFNPPLDGLIETIGKERLMQEYIRLERYINTRFLTKLLDDHFNKIQNHTYKLWQLLYFSRWIHFNLEDSSPSGL